jgi:predicted dithiol-disulfide oxidoreductase (DUF899 family)
MTTLKIATPSIVSRDQWVEARKKLLLKEKSHTRQGDALAAERRDLPWVRIDKNYVFDAPGGKESLADLFEGRSQLVVQHFMFGPDWKEGCPSCSFMADHVGGALVHLAHRDVAFVAVSRAPLTQIEAFRQRMGWGFKWVSSSRNDFNHDYGVSFTKEEMAQGEVYYNYRMQRFPSEEAPGISVFYRDEAGNVFHTYSTYGRGCETMMGTYRLLDLVPKGRDEAGVSMGWLRHHDKYSG